MTNQFSRRRFIEQTSLAGGGVVALGMLGACGAGGDDAGSAPVVATPTAAAPPPPGVTRTEWRPLRIGAGGFVTGIDIVHDGTRVVRTDGAGAYIWNASKSEWKQLLTTTGMPANEWGHEIGASAGVYEIVIAPSDPSRIYMAFNGYIFKSTNKGVSFSKTSMTKMAMDANDAFRLMGRKLAVDPINPDVVYFGTAKSGLFVTDDGGASWKNHPEVPVATTDAGVIVAFDPASARTGGKTGGIYVSSHGNGIFASNDGGATFVKLAGSPTAHRRMVVGADGVLWHTDSSLTESNLRRFAAGRWATMSGLGNSVWHSIAVDPANPKHVVAGGRSGSLVSTSDGGETWTKPMFPGWPAGAGNRVAIDVPWLAWTNEDSMSNGDMRFDPSDSNELVFAEGIGVWVTNPPLTWATYNWTSQSRGIENLVSNHIVAPPGGSPLYFAWDRPVFKLDNPDVFPATHGPNRKYSINMGWSGDYAIDDPKFVVGLMNWWGLEESGYSTDGGTSWTKFGGVPADVAAGKIGGSIAVGTRDNMVWLPNNNANPWVTRDRGNTWQPITVPATVPPGETGWGFAYYTNRHVLVADKATAGTFYMYNYRGTMAGIYRSTNGGVDWARMSTGEVAGGSGFNAKLGAVPGKAGHLFFTSGHQSGANPANTKFMRSTDGGASWTEVANVLEVYSFGFGKAASGSDYPVIFIAGYVNNAWGIWRSDDNAATWIKIGDYPLGCPDLIKTVSGDMDRFGRCYIGFGGSGAAYSELVTT